MSGMARTEHQRRGQQLCQLCHDMSHLSRLERFPGQLSHKKGMLHAYDRAVFNMYMSISSIFINQDVAAELIITANSCNSNDQSSALEPCHHS